MSTNNVSTTIHTSALNKLHTSSNNLSSILWLSSTFQSPDWYHWAPYMLTFIHNSLTALYFTTQINPILWLTQNRPLQFLTGGNQRGLFGLKKNWGGLRKRSKLNFKRFQIGSQILKPKKYTTLQHPSYSKPFDAKPFFHPTFLKLYKVGYQKKLPLFNPYIRLKAARAFFFEEQMSLKKPLAKLRRSRNKSVTKNPYHRFSELYSGVWQRVWKKRRTRNTFKTTKAIEAKAYRSYKKGLRVYFNPLFKGLKLSHHQRCRSVGISPSLPLYNLVRAERYYNKMIVKYTKEATVRRGLYLQNRQTYKLHYNLKRIVCQEVLQTRKKWLRVVAKTTSKLGLRLYSPQTIEKLRQSLLTLLLKPATLQPEPVLHVLPQFPTKQASKKLFYSNFIIYRGIKTRRMRNYLNIVNKTKRFKHNFSSTLGLKPWGLVPNYVPQRVSQRSYKLVSQKTNLVIHQNTPHFNSLINNSSNTNFKLFLKPLWLKEALVNFKDNRLLKVNYSCLYENHPRLMRVAFPKKPRRMSLRVRREAYPRPTLFMNVWEGRLNLPKARPLKNRLLQTMLRFHRRRFKRVNHRQTTHYFKFLNLSNVLKKLVLSPRSKVLWPKIKNSSSVGGYILKDQTVQLLGLNDNHTVKQSQPLVNLISSNVEFKLGVDMVDEFLTDYNYLSWRVVLHLGQNILAQTTTSIYYTLTDWFMDRDKTNTVWNILHKGRKAPLKTLNEFSPAVFNAAYYAKKDLKAYAADFAIHSKYKTNFILSNLGFLYNLPMVHSIGRHWRANINKQKYSFFNIEFVKKAVLKRRNMFKIQQMGEVAPMLNSTQFTDSNVFTINTLNLLNVNKFLHTRGLPLERAYDYPRSEKPFYYTRPEKASDFQVPQIRRIRFKPGYSRIWRSARASLNQSLKLNLRYQYRLTVHLQRFNKMNFNKMKKLMDLRLMFALTQARFSTDPKTTLSLLDSSSVFINGNCVSNPQLLLFQGDVLQLAVNLKYYIVNRWLTNWTLFKRTRLAKLARSKFKQISNTLTKQRSRTTPNWVLEVHTKRTDIAKYFEVDYFTLSAFVIYDPFLANEVEFEPSLESRAQIYRLYNWKYVN